MQGELKKLTSLTSWFLAIQAVTLIVLLAVSSFLYFDLRGMKEAVLASANGSGRPEPVRELVNWKDYIRAHNPSTGNDDAEIVVVEFTDFQCPFCRSFDTDTRRLLQDKYGTRLRFVLKHFPIDSIHPEATLAAVAAQCANREGKFWELKEALFENPQGLTIEYLIDSGVAIGLGDPYEECVRTQDTRSEVAADIRDGNALEVKGTPTFVINGRMAVGAVPLSQFDFMIKGDPEGG